MPRSSPAPVCAQSGSGSDVGAMSGALHSVWLALPSGQMTTTSWRRFRRRPGVMPAETPAALVASGGTVRAAPTVAPWAP
ncbi:MAG: hypothetical protein LBD70_00875 [Bifidobacteriaceae bacterium]|nr:hypothetical protein [Bifidobacteriaceae bacterium]